MLLLPNQSGLAGDALPGAVSEDPGVSEPAMPGERLSLFEAFVAISAVDHGSVPVDLNRHPLVVDLLILHLAVDGAGEKLLFVHQGAVVIDIHETVCEELVERGGILALFRMVPGGFECAQVALLTAGFRRFLCNHESG